MLSFFTQNLYSRLEVVLRSPATPRGRVMNRFVSVLALSGITALAGCVAPTPKANDPYYAPVLPRTPLPAAANNGSIYQAGFEQIGRASRRERGCQYV